MAAELGLREKEYYDMTPIEFERLYRGFRLNIEREWDRTRTLIAVQINMNSKQKVKPQDIIPLAITDAQIGLSEKAQTEYHKKEQDRLLKFVERRNRKHGKL